MRLRRDTLPHWCSCCCFSIYGFSICLIEILDFRHTLCFLEDSQTTQQRAVRFLKAVSAGAHADSPSQAVRVDLKSPARSPQQSPQRRRAHRRGGVHGLNDEVRNVLGQLWSMQL